MERLVFKHCHSAVAGKEIEEFGLKLQPEIERIRQVSREGYEDIRSSVNLPVDGKSLKSVEVLVKKKKITQPRFLVVAGIGGSNLGTIAVQQSVLGSLYNQLDPETRVFYADTVDSDQINSIVRIIEPVLAKGGKMILNAVSKSGLTTETAANFQVITDLMKKYMNDYEEHIVITTQRDSAFWNLGMEKNFNLLEIPEKVGGRYSVFSPVGLFPLGIMGADIEKLVRGATDMRARCMETDIYSNPAALGASLIKYHAISGKNIYDLFLFGPDLEAIGRWQRQLIGESIGKEYNIKGERVFEGITPTVSVGSTDLHSMAQLYLGGPHDKYTTFVWVNKDHSNISVPENKEYSGLVSGIQGRTYHKIMEAIYRGVKIAYSRTNRPFSEIIIPDKKEESIGQLLQLKMMEVMYLGYLFEVNPFDQPNVEEYKSETRRILEVEE